MLIRLTETGLKNIIHGVVSEILREPLYTNTINKKDPSKRNHSYVGRDKKYGIETYIPEIQQHFGQVDRNGDYIIASEPLDSEIDAEWHLDGSGSNFKTMKRFR